MKDSQQLFDYKYTFELKGVNGTRGGDRESKKQLAEHNEKIEAFAKAFDIINLRLEITYEDDPESMYGGRQIFYATASIKGESASLPFLFSLLEAIKTFTRYHGGRVSNFDILPRSA